MNITTQGAISDSSMIVALSQFTKLFWLLKNEAQSELTTLTVAPSKNHILGDCHLQLQFFLTFEQVKMKLNLAYQKHHK